MQGLRHSQEQFSFSAATVTAFHGYLAVLSLHKGEAPLHISSGHASCFLFSLQKQFGFCFLWAKRQIRSPVQEQCCPSFPLRASPCLVSRIRSQRLLCRTLPPLPPVCCCSGTWRCGSCARSGRSERRPGAFRALAQFTTPNMVARHIWRNSCGCRISRCYQRLVMKTLVGCCKQGQVVE